MDAERMIIVATSVLLALTVGVLARCGMESQQQNHEVELACVQKAASATEALLCRQKVTR